MHPLALEARCQTRVRVPGPPAHPTYASAIEHCCSCPSWMPSIGSLATKTRELHLPQIMERALLYKYEGQDSETSPLLKRVRSSTSTVSTFLRAVVACEETILRRICHLD